MTQQKWPHNDAVDMFDKDRLLLARNGIRQAVASQMVPSATVCVMRHRKPAVQDAYGYKQLRPRCEQITYDTLYDLASLTKVIATTSAVLHLFDTTRIGPETLVSDVLPIFSQESQSNGKAVQITIRMLLTHCAGFPAGGNYRNMSISLDEIVSDIFRRKRIYTPGSQFLYSDFSFIILGAIITAVSGLPLDVYVQKHIFQPLEMTDTCFNPNAHTRNRCAATAELNSTNERGYVHDPTARAMGGVSGHAGLFSTAGDLAIYCQMLLDHGYSNGQRILRRSTVALMSQRQSPFVGNDRGFGVDLASSYNIRGELSPSSYGHTGFTGTSVWIDPSNDLFVVLLTNATHANKPVSLSRIRQQLNTRISTARTDE